MRISITKTITVNGQSILKTADADITDEQASQPGFVERIAKELFDSTITPSRIP